MKASIFTFYSSFLTVVKKTPEIYYFLIASLRGASDLLLQYEKMLEAELERRQESYNQDMYEYNFKMNTKCFSLGLIAVWINT